MISKTQSRHIHYLVAVIGLCEVEAERTRVDEYAPLSTYEAAEEKLENAYKEFIDYLMSITEVKE